MESEKSAEPMDINETGNNKRNDNDVPINNQIQIEEATKTAISTKTTIALSNPLTNIVKVKPITSTTVTKIIPSTTLAKIAPKPNASSIVKQTSSSGGGKLVLIQSPSGTSQTIRIAGTTTTPVSSSLTSTNSGTPAGGLRLLKMSDGQVYHVQNKNLSGTTLARVFMKDSTGTPQRIILSTPSSSANKNISKTMASLALSTSNPTRTYTVAQAQQLGLLSASKIKELVTAAAASSTNVKKTFAPTLPISTITTTTTPPPTSSTNVLQTATTAIAVTTTAANVITVTASITSPTITSTSAPVAASTSIVVSDNKLKSTSVQQQQPLISTQKIILKTAGGMQKQMSLPQNIVKLAQGGQIRAVNVPGRGIQYVRVISNSTTATTSGTTISSSDTNTLIATASGASKVLLQSGSTGGKQTLTLLSSSPSTSSLNNDETKANKAIKSGVVTTKPIPTTQPTLVPINKTQSIVSKVAGPSMGNVAKKEVSENMDKITQFLQANQSKMANNSNATTISSSLIIKKTVKDEPDLIQKRETNSSEYSNADNKKSQYRPEKKVYENLISMEMMPIKSDHDDVKDNIADDDNNDDDNSNSNDNIPINKKTPPSSLPDDAPRRKHCNCTKSQCLKLYCDCFANGEFCFNCTCKECFNNLENETERANAIKSCIERNPHAFKPKIGKAKDKSDTTLRRHTKGCNCKRSGCLKNYCECYEAKICCSANCKCMGCRNVIESFGQLIDPQSIKLEPQTQQSSITNRKRSMDQNNEPQSIPMASASSKPTASGSSAKNSTLPTTSTAVKKPCNFMTQDVIEATVQCIISQADDCQQQNMDKTTSEKMILEEFGRCLVEIIEFSLKNNDN